MSGRPLLKAFNNEGQLIIEAPKFRQEKMRMYDNNVFVFGEVLNPDVIQLMTPAGIRDEHAIATLCSYALTSKFDMQALKSLITWTSNLIHNNLIYYVVHPNKQSAIIVFRFIDSLVNIHRKTVENNNDIINLLEYYESDLACREPVTFGTLVGVAKTKNIEHIDALDLWIPFKKPNTIKMVPRLTNDSLVGLLDGNSYYYRDNGKKGFLVAQICDLVEKINTANNELKDVGGLATLIEFPDISTSYPPVFISLLTNLVYNLSNGNLQLICPEYKLHPPIVKKK